MAKTLTFDARFCRPGRWQKSGSKPGCSNVRNIGNQSTTSRMSARKIIGPYVCCPQAC